jgi:hypothetical protein
MAGKDWARRGRGEGMVVCVVVVVLGEGGGLGEAQSVMGVCVHALC